MVAVFAVAVGTLAWAGLASGTQPYATYESTVAADGPVAQYRFDDAAGSSTLADSAGSYTATNSGIVLGGEGPFGGSKSGSFGTSAFASLPSDPLAGSTAFSAEGWVDWTGGSSYKQPIFDFGSSPTNYMYLTPASSLTGHTMLFEIRTSAGTVFQVTAPTLKSKAWEYVAVTETSSGTLTLYLNGAQVGETTGATITPASLGTIADDYLGKSLISGEPSFNGSMSNVAFYSKALSAEQVKAHYNAAKFPVNTVLPTVSGTAQEGQTLTAAAGTWTGLTPITYTYQWTLCEPSGAGCANIASATKTTYKATSEDVGRTLRIAVTASNSAGSSSASSNQTATVAPLPPANTKLPALSGTAKDGQVLTVSTGTWTGTPPLSYGYQWEACNSSGAECASISGATASTYRVVSSEIGGTLRVVVTASNAGGSASATSAVSAVIAAGVPVNTVLPEVSGTAVEGQTLSASTGTWAGTAPFTYTYQWTHCNSAGESCANLSGATKATYVLGSSNVGTTLRVVVTAKNASGSAKATSSATGVVTVIPPSNKVAPVISGEAKDGQTLTASSGTWSGTPTITYAYQWETCNTLAESCSNILGATASSYALGLGEVGETLRVVVTATNAAGSVSSTSEPTASVAGWSGCNVSWTGSAGDGAWQTAGNWSTGAVPTARQRACIPTGATVHITGGTSEAGALESKGNLVISGGTLDLTDAGAVSEVVALTESEGNVAGAGTLDVSGSLSWTGGSMSGPGSTVLGPDAVASIASATLASRELTNEGTLTVDGQIASGWQSPGTLLNTGTVQKSEGSETTVIGTVFDNEGAVSVTSGSLELAGGGATPGGHSGSWTASGSDTSVVFSYGEYHLGPAVTLSGQVAVTNDAHVYAQQVKGAGAQLTVTPNSYYAIGGGVLDIEGPAVSTIAKLEVTGILGFGSGSLTGAGLLDVTESFVGAGYGYMDGTGTTVIEPGASALVSGTLGMEGRTLQNAGTLTIGEGGSIGGGKLVNTGTLQKTEGSGAASIGSSFDNEGLVSVTSGKLELTGGGSAGEHTAGSWSAAGSGTGIVFNSRGATFALGSSVTLSGWVEILDGTVSAGTIDGAAASVTATGDGPFQIGTLEVTGGTASTVGTLTLNDKEGYYGGAVAGSGELDITKSFAAGYGSGMDGSGSTVIEPGATGSVAGSLSLEERTLQNAGALTVGHTDYINGSKHARLLNSGTFTLNADHAYGLVAGTGSATLINTGTLQKTEESNGPTPIGFAIDNEGLIKADTGQLEFTGGGESGVFASNSWVAEPGASIALDGFQYVTYSLGAHATVEGSMIVDATISAGAIEGDGNLISKLGNITFTGLTASTVGSITLEQEPPDVWVPKEQSLYVTSELEIEDALTWGSDYGAIDGPGTIVTAPRSTTRFDGGNVRLEDGQFVNEGTATWESGGIDSRWDSGTFFVNRGTFQANVQYWEPPIEGCVREGATFQCPVFENYGTITAVLPGRAEGAPAYWPHINWEVDLYNYGDLEVPYQAEEECPGLPPYGWPSEACVAREQYVREIYAGLLLKEGAQVGEPPHNITPPTITGTPEEEQTLHATTGTWTGSPTPSFTYQWEECDGEDEGEPGEEHEVPGTECEVLPGATNPNYKLEDEEVGYTMRVVVTATNEFGSATSTSEATPVIEEPAYEVPELEEGGPLSRALFAPAFSPEDLNNGEVSRESLYGRAETLYKYFATVGYYDRVHTGKFLYRFQIAAMIGNFVFESRHTLSPHEEQEPGVDGFGVGIAQWTRGPGQRWEHVEEWGKEHPERGKNSEYTLKTQERVVWQELTGHWHEREYEAALGELESQRDIEDATEVFIKKFEKPQLESDGELREIQKNESIRAAEEVRDLSKSHSW